MTENPFCEIMESDPAEPITVHTAEVLAVLWFCAGMAEYDWHAAAVTGTREAANTFYAAADAIMCEALGIDPRDLSSDRSDELVRANELVWRVLDMPRHAYAIGDDWR